MAALKERKDSRLAWATISFEKEKEKKSTVAQGRDPFLLSPPRPPCHKKPNERKEDSLRGSK